MLLSKGCARLIWLKSAISKAVEMVLIMVWCVVRITVFSECFGWRIKHPCVFRPCANIAIFLRLSALGVEEREVGHSPDGFRALSQPLEGDGHGRVWGRWENGGIIRQDVRYFSVFRKPLGGGVNLLRNIPIFSKQLSVPVLLFLSVSFCVIFKVIQNGLPPIFLQFKGVFCFRVKGDGYFCLIV